MSGQQRHTLGRNDVGLNESGCPFFGAMVGTAAV